MEATVTIERGSWFSPSGKLLRAGVHLVKDDPVLVAEAETASRIYDWIKVNDPGVEAAVARAREARALADAALEVTKPRADPAPKPILEDDPPKGHTQIIDADPTADDTGTQGPLTSADLKQEAFSCGLCPDFTTKAKAALMSHRRARHPELDPATGAPKAVAAENRNVHAPTAPPSGVTDALRDQGPPPDFITPGQTARTGPPVTSRPAESSPPGALAIQRA